MTRHHPLVPGRRGAAPWAAVLALVPALVVSGGASSGAAAAGSDLVTVDGTAVVVIVDDFDGASALPDSFVSVDVDGALVPVPDAAGDGLTSGQPVEVTLDAPAGMSTDQAVEAAADGDVPVVDVVATGAAPAEAAPAAGGGLQAASPAGPHTITVLPVYWTGGTAPDTTVAQLQTMAAESAAYWTETSGGTMTFTAPVVRSFVQIAAPAGCSISNGQIEALWEAALTAHGFATTTPASNNHVVVYFPDYPSCGGWLGLASTWDGRIWVNGYPTSEVLAHEMGHNLGLGHANAKVCFTSPSGATGQVPFLVENPNTPDDGRCLTQEYGDYADLMGNVWDLPSGNLNSSLANELAMVDIATVSSSAVTAVQLAPLWDEAGVRTVRIPGYGSRAFFVDYRPATDRDTRQPTWAGVQVHERNVDNDGTPVSYLLAMDPAGPGAGVAMPTGTRYTFPAGVGGRWTVVLDDVGATASVRVIPPAGFTDVVLTHPFYADIAWLRHTGISTGWSSSGGLVYRPTQSVTREAMAAFLYRAAGSPAFTPPATSPFVDVSTGHPFYAAIAWMAAEGISTGTETPSGAYYKPGDPVARDAMAAFLYRAAGEPAFTPPATSPFVDVPTSHPFYTAIAWMAATGISTGTVTPSGAYFKPADAVSREAMAAFLFRFDSSRRA